MTTFCGKFQEKWSKIGGKKGFFCVSPSPRRGDSEIGDFLSISIVHNTTPIDIMTTVERIGGGLLRRYRGAGLNPGITDDLPLLTIQNKHWRFHRHHYWLDSHLAWLSLLYFTFMAYVWLPQQSAPNQIGMFLFWILLLTILPFISTSNYTAKKQSATIELEARTDENDDLFNDNIVNIVVRERRRPWIMFRTLSNITYETVKHWKIWEFGRSCQTMLSTVLLLVPILFLESYFEKQNLLTTYYAFVIMFRLVSARTIYDSVALVIVYAAFNLNGLSSYNDDIWLCTTRLVLMMSLVFGSLCAILLRRTHFRMWEIVSRYTPLYINSLVPIMHSDHSLITVYMYYHILLLV